MAFTSDTLGVFAQPIGNRGIRFHNYQTDDTVTAVTTAGYFQDVARFGMRVGDLVFVLPETPEGFASYIANIISMDDGSATVTVEAGTSGRLDIFLDHLAEQPVPEEIRLLGDLYTALADDWIYLDGLWLLSSSSEEMAGLNHVDPGIHALTLSGSPVFTADQGFTGNGTDARLMTGVDPRVVGSKFTRDQAFMAVGVRTDHAGSAMAGACGSAGSAYYGLSPYDTNIAATICSTSGGAPANLNHDSRGVWHTSRIASTQFKTFADTRLMYTITNTSAALSGAREFAILANNANYGTHQVTFAAIGGFPTHEQGQAFVGKIISGWLIPKGLW